MLNRIPARRFLLQETQGGGAIAPPPQHTLELYGLT